MGQNAQKVFQKCRWYDPYPRLAFALKLLSLAPQDVQRNCWKMILTETEAALSRLLQDDTPERTLDRLMDGWMSEESLETPYPNERRRPLQGNFNLPCDKREDFPSGLKALLMLKNSPNSVKSQITSKLLAILKQS